MRDDLGQRETFDQETCVSVVARLILFREINNMKHKGTIRLSPTMIQNLERFLKVPICDCGRGEIIFDQEHLFDNGMRMAIQIVTSETPDEEPAWTQGVLYDKKGNELNCTEVGESLCGEFAVKYGSNEYVVEVVMSL